ncbi:MAG: hypothetical protein ABL872_04590 [Lacibacter sp.]
MKTLISITTFIFLGCNSPTKNNSLSQVDTVVKKQNTIDKSQFYLTTDSVIISSKHFDTIVYSKKDFNEIVDNFPSLYATIPVHPDISYAQSGYYKDIVEADGNKKHLTFGSEVGQDQYYILYSYFLKKKNEGNDLNIRRENLISIYHDINDIFGLLTYGGTYFGHQFNRINGYAEYGVYQFKENSDIFNRLLDIKEQKKLYLASLRQIILEELKVDNEIPDKKSKEKRQAELYKYVEHLDSLISDNFYLKKAQEFQYSNY